MEVMTIGGGYWRMWIGWFSALIASIFIRNHYLQYISFLTLSNKKSGIVSPIITVCTWRKKREIKIVSILVTFLLFGLLTQPELAKWLR